jgi:hypothetical protein
VNPVKISAGVKSRLVSLIESSTRTGLKFGIPAMVITAAYLLYIVFGPKLLMAGMSAVDQAYLHNTVALAERVLRVAALVVALSLSLRFFYEPAAGQLMTILGGVLWFFSPAMFEGLTLGTLTKNPTYQGIVSELSRVGFVTLVPGAVLLLREIGARIARGVRTRVLAGRCWGDEEERAKKHRRRKIYEQCWDMAFCREYVRGYCTAFEQKKPCWRMKAGCYCDGDMIMRAMAAGANDNRFVRGIMQSIEEDDRRRNEMSASQKRMRCRRCVVYAEHQRQKYRVLSPLVFPAVGLFFWLYYNQLSACLWRLLESTDRFISFLAYNPSAAPSFASQGPILTTFAMVWLAIMILSYALRVLEYLIFRLQV